MSRAGRIGIVGSIAIAATTVWVVSTGPVVEAVDPVDNPLIEESCGVNTTLVLDASGSINQAHAVDDVRKAATAFLDSLTNTDSQARITQFGTATEQLAPPTLITSASVSPGGVHAAAVAGYYNPRPSRPAGVDWHRYDGSGNPDSAGNFDPGNNNKNNQYTNWDASLHQAADTPAEIVVYITDGEPSAYDLDKPSDPFDQGPPPDQAFNTNRGQADSVTLDRAIEEANVVKTAGTRMLVVGVGKATTDPALVQRLVDISGPKIVRDADLGSIDSLNDIDVAVVTDFTDLAAFLRKVVLQLCSPSLTITKLAQTPGSASYTPQTGWDITTTPEVPGGGNPPFNWILPDTAPATSKTVSTNANGVAQFQWEPDPPEEDSRATVSEVLQPGYSAGRIANTDYRCEARDERANVRVIEGDLANLSFVLDPIGQEVVTCKIWNSFDYAPDIALAKVDAPTSLRGDLAPEATVISSFTATNPGNTPLAGITLHDDLCTVEPVPATGANAGDSNGDGRLDPGEAWQYTCSRGVRTGASVDPTGLDITNTATVTGTDPEGTVVTDTASATITAWNPAISLEKLVNGVKTDTISSGEDAAYTFAVTNAGNTPLGTVTLTDVATPAPQACTPIARGADSPGNDDDVLDVGEVWNYSCTNTPSEPVSDQAEVTAVPLDPDNGQQPFPDPNPAVSAQSSASVTVVNAAIDLVKTATPNVILLNEAGDPETVTYTFTATNPGDAPLARPTGNATDPGWVVDPQCDAPTTYVSGDTNTNELLDTSETWTFTCTNQVAQRTVNIAVIIGQPVDGQGQPVGATVGHVAAALVEVAKPGMEVGKRTLRPEVLSITTTPAPELGPDTPNVRPASYLYGVDNTGNVPLSLAGTPPTDDKCAPLTLVRGDDNNNQLLDPNEVWEYTCEIALNRVADSNVPPVTGNESGVVENTFTVVGVPFFQGQLEPGKQVSRTATAQTQVIEPGIALSKTPSADAVLAGSDVTYTFVVSNTGDVGMPITGPDDDKCAPVTYVSGDLNNNGLVDGANGGTPEAWTFTCTRAVGLPAPPETLDENMASVSAVDTLGNTYFAQAQAQVRVIRPDVSLTKTVSESLVPVGTSVSYGYDVTNTGTSPIPIDDVLDQVVLLDTASPPQPSCVSPAFTGGDTNGNGMLDRVPAEVWTYECSAALNADTTNIAGVTAIGGSTLVPPLAVQVFSLAGVFVGVFDPGIAITKTAAPTFLVGGGEVTYTYEVTNTGDVPLANVSATITDDTCSPVTYVSGDIDNDGLLDSPNSIFEDSADETWIFTCTTSVTQTTTNVVDVTGSPVDAGGTDLCDSDTPRIASTCDVTAQATAVVEVVESGQIIIAKQTTTPSDQVFEFTSASVGGFSLTNGESETFANLDPGTYSVTEQDVASWSIRSIDCVDPNGNSAGDPSSGVVTINLDAGESVRCTYVNHFATIPDTGSDSTRPLIVLGIGLVALGAAFWAFGAGRRRRRLV